MKIRCVLVEDMSDAMHILEIYCGMAEGLEVVGKYMSGEEFLAEKDKLEFDACFLDIQMGGISGMDCAQLLEDKAVVFVSANTNRAVEAFGINAVDFVAKPVNKSRFMEAVEKVRERLKGGAKFDYAWFNTDKGKYRLKLGNVQMVQRDEGLAPDPRDKVVVMADGERVIVKDKGLKEFAEILPGKDFVQVNRQTMIRLAIFRSQIDHNRILVRLPAHDQPGYTEEMELDLGESFRPHFCKKVGLE